jgi:ferredoxin-NADP reductase
MEGRTLQSAVETLKRAPLDWQVATLKTIRQETPTVRTFTFSLPGWTRHTSGQHYDLRLTAQDGYQAQHSYSVSSGPDQEGEIDLTVERVEGGEVSSHLHDVLVPGDGVELRGPVGGYFVWEVDFIPEPLVLIADGPGIAPLMSMIRHRSVQRTKIPARLLYSSRSIDEIIFYDELETLQSGRNGLQVFHTLTHTRPDDWSGYSRRIDRAMLEQLLDPFGEAARIYLCGPTATVEAAADILAQLGLPPAQIRMQRFGPSAGQSQSSQGG